MGKQQPYRKTDYKPIIIIKNVVRRLTFLMYANDVKLHSSYDSDKIATLIITHTIITNIVYNDLSLLVTYTKQTTK